MLPKAQHDPGGHPTTGLEAFTLAALAFDAGARGEDAARVADLATRALQGELLAPDPLAGGYAYLITGVALMWADQLDAAERLYDGLKAEARRQGSAVLLSIAAGQSALVHERRGALAEAAADAAEALALAREATGTEGLLNTARATAVSVALEQGETVDEAVLDGEPDAMPYILVLQARAEAKLARGDLQGALEDFRACGAHGSAWGAENPSVCPVALARGVRARRAGGLRRGAPPRPRGAPAGARVRRAARDRRGAARGRDDRRAAAAADAQGGGRRAGGDPGAAGARPRAGRPRRRAAPRRPALRRPRAARPRPRARHPLRRRAADGPRPRGAADRRRAPAPGRAQRRRSAHPERAPRRRAGRQRPHQPRHRAAAVRDREDRRGAHARRLPEARHLVADAARQALA